MEVSYGWIVSYFIPAPFPQISGHIKRAVGSDTRKTTYFDWAIPLEITEGSQNSKAAQLREQ